MINQISESISKILNLRYNLKTRTRIDFEDKIIPHTLSTQSEPNHGKRLPKETVVNLNEW